MSSVSLNETFPSFLNNYKLIGHRDGYHGYYSFTLRQYLDNPYVVSTHYWLQSCTLRGRGGVGCGGGGGVSDNNPNCDTLFIARLFTLFYIIFFNS